MKFIILFACIAMVMSLGEEGICTGTSTVLDDEVCNGAGYCVQGSVSPELVGCACLPGVSGSECEVSAGARECVSADVTATTSEFVTSIGGYEQDGEIVLLVNTPVENGEGDVDDNNVTLTNYATFTRLRFLNEDTCDYPEGNVTEWTRETNETECTEQFAGVSSFEDLVGCTGSENAYCLDSEDTIIEGCVPADCTNPPCSRCYPGSVMATRGYVRTSASGALTRPATAENCHYFAVCLPWIEDVEADVQVTFIPDFPRNFILTRVAFSCFEDIFDDDCVVDPENSWLVEIQAAVNYPWFLVESAEGGALVDNDSGATYELKGIHNSENCDVEGEQCVQTLHFAIPGCNTLENATSLNITGLEYDCNADGCDAAKDQLDQQLAASAQILIQSTQDNCGADFSIDATETVTLEMNSYFSDYADENSVFVAEDETLGTSYFRIDIDSNLPVTAVNIITVTSTEAGVETVLEEGVGYTMATGEGIVNGCPATVAQPAACFFVDVADVLSEEGLASDDLITLDVAATVEISYEPVEKRSIKRSVSGLGTEFGLNQNIRVVGTGEETPVGDDDDSSAASIGAFFALSMLALF